MMYSKASLIRTLSKDPTWLHFTFALAIKERFTSKNASTDTRRSKSFLKKTQWFEIPK